MSEFHPNRTKLVRTKPKVTARRILEAWPLLVWLLVIFVAWRIYAKGVTFTRMNGLVDVYQINIAPVNDGRLLAVKVQRGQRVEAREVVAVMDSSNYVADLEGLKQRVIIDRNKEVRDLTSDLIKLQSEQREMDREDAEDGAAIGEYKRILDEWKNHRDSVNKGRPASQQFPPNELETKNQVEYEKTVARRNANTKNRGALKTEIDIIVALIDKAKSDALRIVGVSLATDEILKTGALREDEQQDFVELRTKIELCQLRTPQRGTIDRIVKEPGEFIMPGDGVLKVVGDPEKLICFLPQDQSDQLKPGDKVWVAATSAKMTYYETTVDQVSPRINALADPSSPLPNQRVHGRDVMLNYPQDARPEKHGGRPQLLPGQTLIIYTKQPGETGIADWFNSIFHNDDTVR